MILSHSHKFIFIRIPRTGGSAISKSLRKYHFSKSKKRTPTHGHYGHKKLRKYIDAGYFVFTFIRNPFIQVLSHSIYKGCELKEFIINHSVDYHKYIDYANFVGKYENIEEDLNTVCMKLGINHEPIQIINNSSNKFEKDFINKIDQFYTTDIIRIIIEKYSDILIKYNYSYPGDKYKSCAE